MTITEHKILVAANIDDPIVGELIEVSSNGKKWYAGKFTVLSINAQYWIDTKGYDVSSWPYARRPATTHQQHMADLDKGIKAAEAGIKRHLEQRRQIPVEDRAGNDLGEADEVAENGRNVGQPAKQYRPWRDATEVPAPLMVRRKSDMPTGEYRYAYPALDGIRVSILEGNISVSYKDMCWDWVQHNGQPCGT